MSESLCRWCVAVHKWLKIGRFGYLPWSLWWTPFLGYFSCTSSFSELDNKALLRRALLHI